MASDLTNDTETQFIYAAADLRRVADISEITYDQWKARGFVKSEYRARGAGNRQMFSFAEVFRVTVLTRLVRLGLSISSADLVVNDGPLLQIFQHKGRKSTFWIVRPGLNGFVGTSATGQELEKDLRERGDGIVISLDSIAAHVKNELETKE